MAQLDQRDNRQSKQQAATQGSSVTTLNTEAEVQQSNLEKAQSTLRKTSAVAAAAVAASIAPNPVLARAALTGAYKAVQNLTPEQENFLSSLSRKREIQRDSFSSYSQIVEETPLGEFPFAFETPAVQALGFEARQKVGITG